MVDRDDVIPPLLSAVLQLRDSLPWEAPTTISPELSLREAETPYGGQKALRFTTAIPDVQIAVFAQLFNYEPGRHPNVDSGVLHRFDIPGPEQEHEEESEFQNAEGNRGGYPHSDGSHGCHLIELATGHAASVASHLASDCGGVDHDTLSCPTWFPAVTREQCPLDPTQETLFHFRKRSAIPRMKDRDYAGRSLGVIDMSDASPLAKEAIGSSSETLYVLAFSSTADAAPAFRGCVRGGAIAAVIFQGPADGALGTLADFFWLVEPMSNMVTHGMLKRGFIQDHLHQIKAARLLQKSFPQPVAFQSRELRDVSLDFVSDIRLQRFGDAAQPMDVGCGSRCTLQ